MGYKITWEDRVVVKRYWGRLTADEFFKSSESIRGERRFDDIRYIINDLTDVESHDFDEEAIIQAVAMHLGTTAFNPNYRIAFVTGNHELANLAGRINDVLLDEKHEIQNFSAMAEARNWILNEAH